MSRSKFKRRQAPDWNHCFGPWALVTGASDGIGQAMAHAPARRGIHLALCARRRERIDALSDALRSRYAIQTRVVSLDLARSEAPGELMASLADLDLGLRVAYASFGSAGHLTSRPIDSEMEMVDVNCRAVLALCHGIAPRLQTRGRGGIIRMSSLFAFQGVPGSANYAATKAYVQALAEGLALELRGDGVDVLACAPGPAAASPSAPACA
jgi:short-subunit dehydrogenase